MPVLRFRKDRHGEERSFRSCEGMLDVALQPWAEERVDSLECSCTREKQLDFLITRNVGEHPKGPAFVMTTKVFLSTLP